MRDKVLEKLIYKLGNTEGQMYVQDWTNAIKDLNELKLSSWVDA